MFETMSDKLLADKWLAIDKFKFGMAQDWQHVRDLPLHTLREILTMQTRGKRLVFEATRDKIRERFNGDIRPN